MSARRVSKGEVIAYKNAGATDIAYLDVVSLTNRIGIAADKIAAGATGSLEVVGVFELPAVNNAAFSAGDKLYWDATNGKLTKTATDMIPAGWCVADKAETATLAQVKLDV